MIDRLAWGGAERVLVTLAGGLRERGFDVRVVQMGSRGWHPWVAELQSLGVPVVDLGLRSLLDVRRVLSLVLYLRSERIDVLHTHLRHSDLVGRVAAVLARRPVISTIHNIAEVQPGWRESVRRRLDYVSARAFCPVLITVSEAQRHSYQRATRIDPARLETHLNGVDTRQFRPDAVARAQVRAELGLAADAPVFVTVAALKPGKGIHDLLEAAALVRKQLPAARFVIAGDGQERSDLEARAAQLGLGATVLFLGARTDVPALLAAADACVHPSLFEALPTTVIEAMAVGLPVIATSVGGTPELVNNETTGVLVPPGCAGELAAGILRVWQSPLRAAMGEAARAWVELHASMPVWLDGMVRVYRRIAAAPG
jgi:glycosyltransferase involved in cell wall biosynthesis